MSFPKDQLPFKRIGGKFNPIMKFHIYIQDWKVFKSLLEHVTRHPINEGMKSPTFPIWYYDDEIGEWEGKKDSFIIMALSSLRYPSLLYINIEKEKIDECKKELEEAGYTVIKGRPVLQSEIGTN